MGTADRAADLAGPRFHAPYIPTEQRYQRYARGGCWDSWRTTSSSAGGMAHTALCCFFPSAEQMTQKMFESTSSSQSLLWQASTTQGWAEASSAPPSFCFLTPHQLYLNENEFHRACAKPWPNLKGNCKDDKDEHRKGAALLRHPRLLFRMADNPELRTINTLQQGTATTAKRH